MAPTREGSEAHSRLSSNWEREIGKIQGDESGDRHGGLPRSDSFKPKQASQTFSSASVSASSFHCRGCTVYMLVHL